MTARPGSRWQPDRLAPCGTPAASRRHQRRSERCPICLTAERIRTAETGGWKANTLTSDPRPVRNGIPETAYTWRTRRYPWAERALARAEAVYGRPANEAT